MTRLLLCAAALALPLAACGRPGDGTSVSINADGGTVQGAMDAKTGEVKVNVPGFSGQITLPKIQLDATDLELNGVRLYPGSTIDTMDIAGGKGDNGSGDAGVRIRFTSPADPDRVRGWFETRLANAGFTVKRDGTGLSGTTEEHKPFRLDLDAAGPTRAKGLIVIGG